MTTSCVRAGRGVWRRARAWGVALALCVAALVGEPAHARSDLPPVVLAPGFLGFRTLGPFGAHWRGWRAALEAEGFEVFEHMPTPVATSEQRADELVRVVREVKRRTGAPRVLVIAHSQGGLDARLALERGGAQHIAAVATLSSPHHGTPLADAAVDAFPPSLVQPALALVQRIWQVENEQAFSRPDGNAAVASLTTQARAAVISTTHVPLYSFAAVAGADIDGSCADAPLPAPTRDGALMPMTRIPRALLTSASEVSNDGVVSTRSMRHDRFIGCVAGDHGVWLGWTPTSGFDHEAFAVVLAHGLAAVARTGDPAAFYGALPALRAIPHPLNHGG